MRAYRADPDFASPVTLDEVKANARVDGDFEDQLIAQLILAAHERAEQETGLIFGEGEWIIEASPYRDFTLPIWPVLSVDSVLGGVDPFTDYTLARQNRSVILSSGAWPEAVTIRVQAGMPMPHTVRQAIILMASWWYDMRATAAEGNMQEIPYGATALLGLNRRMFA